MRIIWAAILLTAATGRADEPAALATKKIPAISLLPPGSQLHGMMLPRYDKNQKLSTVLKSAVVTLIDEHRLQGESVNISFYNPDESPRALIELKKAELDQSRGLIRASEEVSIRSERLNARGSALVYQLEQNKGFLSGPVETRIRSKTKTTMTPPQSLIRPTAAMLGSAALGLAGPATGAEPASAAASASHAHHDQAAKSRDSLRADLEASAHATRAAREFLDQAEIHAQSPSQSSRPATQPLETPSSPEETRIECDGGIYFDADEGIIVYLQNVRVNDPRFELSGANELKIFLQKKASADPANTKSFGGNFDKVDRIIATGAVRILQKNPQAGKDPVEASGAIFTYHPETGQIILTGGYPWVKQGATYLRAKQPQLSLSIEKDGSFVTEGSWDMGGKLNSKP